ncbi:MAG: BBP7 family outer membrane beta-barrel protein [Gemmataceae bacterium]
MKRWWLTLMLGLMAVAARPVRAQVPEVEGAAEGAAAGVPGPPIPADMMAPGFEPNLNVWEEPQIVPGEPWALVGIEYLRYYLRKDDYNGFLINNGPGTAPLIGLDDGLQNSQNGGRVTLIVAPTSPVPVEFSGFWVHERGGQQFLSPPLTPARVVNAVNLGALESIPAGVPGVTTGNNGLDYQTDFYGGEANVYVTRNIFLGGRYLALNERCRLYNDNGTAAPFAGSTFVTDDIQTLNELYGGQIGVRGDFNMGPILVELKAKMLMGYMKRTVDIIGNTATVNPDGSIAAIPAGIQAVASNSGNFRDNKFGYVPDLSVNFQIPVFEWFQVVVGYNFLYWQNVVRPGEQYDINVDTRQVPTSPNFVPGLTAGQPSFQNRRSDLWVHGLNVGLAFIY